MSATSLVYLQLTVTRGEMLLSDDHFSSLKTTVHEGELGRASEVLVVSRHEEVSRSDGAGIR